MCSGTSFLSFQPTGRARVPWSKKRCGNKLACRWTCLGFSWFVRPFQGQNGIPCSVPWVCTHGYSCCSASRKNDHCFAARSGSKNQLMRFFILTPKRSYAFTTAASLGTSWRICAMMWSVVMPSASASKFRMSRCLMAASATASMSSKLTLKRP